MKCEIRSEVTKFSSQFHGSNNLHILNFLRISSIYIITLISRTHTSTHLNNLYQATVWKLICASPSPTLRLFINQLSVSLTPGLPSSSALSQSSRPSLPSPTPLRRSPRAAALTARLIFNFEHRCQLDAPVQPAAGCHAHFAPSAEPKTLWS